MLKSNLIEAFKTFSPGEMKDFGEFVNSPYFNKNKNVKKLFEIIRKYYPDLDSDKLKKETVFAKVYSGEKYKDSTMRLLMFYLYEVVEKFLAHSSLANKEIVYSKFITAKELFVRGLNKEFEKTVKQVTEKLDEVNIKDPEYYMDKFRFEYLYMSYLCSVKYDQYDKFINKDNVERVFNNLTYHYLIQVFRFYGIVLSTQTLYNTNVETHLFENIMSTYDSELFKDVPIVNIYYNVVMCLLKPQEESYYYKLKALVLENDEIIGRGELSDIYINLENYCTRKTRAGMAAFMKESFEIMKLEIEKKLYVNDGYMSTLFYKSVVVVACRLEEYEWVLKFIEEYKNDMKEHLRDAVYHFSIAYYQNSMKNYESALEYLAKVKTDDVYLRIDVKNLQCSLFYSLGWLIPLLSLIETFKRTLSNNKLIPEARKLNYMKYIKYLNRLCNLKEKNDKENILELKNEVIKDGHFQSKEWILSEIEKLI